MSGGNKPVAKLVAVDKSTKAKIPLVAVWMNDGRLSFSLERGVRIKAGDVEVTLGRDGAHYGNFYVNEPLAVTNAPTRQAAPAEPASSEFGENYGDDDIPF